MSAPTLHALPPGRLLIFGLGYSALRLVDLLRPRGWSIAGTTRSADKAAALRAGGIDAYLFDRGRPLSADALSGVTHILSSVPPDADGDPVLAEHAADIAGLRALRWLGYLSTTGVYGDTGGAWVDETAPLAATGVRGRRRVEAEAGWASLRQDDAAAHLFRLPGIYGPGRSAIDSLRAGTARRITKGPQVFCRIHVDDIAGAVAACIDRPHPGMAINVVDDEPAPPADIIAYAAQLLGVDPPPLEHFDPTTMTPMAASFYAENRRVRNDRLKGLVGYRLIHPTYREGLAAQMAGDPVTAR